MNRSKLALLTLPVLLITGCKAAEDNADTSADTDASAITDMEQTPAQKAYAEANATMHVGMGKIDPDADIAFMQGMIPHHQGAVDMAEIVLKHGKDPETRALAEAVIASQTAEIEQMQAWLERRNIAPETAEMVEHQNMQH